MNGGSHKERKMTVQVPGARGEYEVIFEFEHFDTPCPVAAEHLNTDRKKFPYMSDLTTCTIQHGERSWTAHAMCSTKDFYRHMTGVALSFERTISRALNDEHGTDHAATDAWVKAFKGIVLPEMAKRSKVRRPRETMRTLRRKVEMQRQRINIIRDVAQGHGQLAIETPIGTMRAVWRTDE